MALGLVVSDNLDGTADLVVTGTLAAPWTVDGYLWGGDPGTMTAVQQAAGTGDGTATVTPTFGGGPILWILRSAGSATQPYFQAIARTGYAPHLLATFFIRDGIRIIGVTGVNSDNIVARRLPKLLGKEHDQARVVCSPFPAEVEVSRLSGKDDINYPVTVAFFRPNDATLNKDMADEFMNRWRVSKAFRNHRPDGIPGAAPLQIRWEPDLPTSPFAVAQNVSAGVIVFKVGYREIRGTV